MKRKLLIALLSLTVAACGFGLVACDKEGEKNSNVEITNINQAYNVATELGYGGTLDEFIIAIKGEKGDKGDKGEDGIDGVGVENIIVDADGEIVIVLTNGDECHLGKINSADGRGIIKAEFNANGEVVFTYSDGTSENIGKIPDCAHIYGEWTTIEEATCTSIGYGIRVCSACGYKDYEFTRAKGHYFDRGITLKEATCTEDGYKQYICYDCNAVKAETVPAIGHSFENGTCANCGRKTYSEGLEFTLSADGTYYILEGMGTCTDVDLIIPETYNNLPVAEIGELAYNKRLNIKSVTIPRNITSIGRFAFSDCTRLEKVYFNAENCADLASWGSDAFIGSGGEHGISVVIGKYVQRIPAHLFDWSASSVSRLVNVVSLTFEADSVLKTIGESAFAVSGLIEVNLPDSVELIGKDAFRQSERLKTVNLGNGVTSVEAGAFDSCGNLENISIPDSITRFEFNNFVYNENLKFNEYKNCLYLGNEQNPYTVLVDVATEEETSYEIHGDTKLVYNGAFAWCRKLESITIPKTVTEIENYAFYECENLKTVYFTGTRGEWEVLLYNSGTNNPVLKTVTVHFGEE
ncbi:MAG: leucine-rich repeat domain-containing protein [Clostridia bacterium]|nr:leucine-rich repeat domain-containing protein [Clostridia bacterium]